MTKERTELRQRQSRVERRGPGLLCVANYPANTGYAWDFIESLYRGLADHFATRGVSTWVAYPAIERAPATLAGSAARPVELAFEPGSLRSVQEVLSFVWRHNIRSVYLTDRTAWHPSYSCLRLAGVSWIVVHDHTSGERTIPTGMKRTLKKLRLSLPGSLADRVVGVSNYVARRKVEVDLIPPARVRRVWNSRPVVQRSDAARERLRDTFGLADGPIVVCASRATAEKGVVHLLRAFDRCVASLGSTATPPTLIYFGDGPGMADVRAVHRGLAAAARIVIAGYRPDAAELAAGADVCVVPSVWQEAFGLAALEPMMYGIPVIASRVGGIPEVVVDGETGILVQPGNEHELETALGALLRDPAERERMGRNGLARARAHFDYEKAIAELIEQFEPAFATS